MKECRKREWSKGRKTDGREEYSRTREMEENKGEGEREMWRKESVVIKRGFKTDDDEERRWRHTHTQRKRAIETEGRRKV